MKCPSCCSQPRPIAARRPRRAVDVPHLSRRLLLLHSSALAGPLSSPCCRIEIYLLLLVAHGPSRPLVALGQFRVQLLASGVPLAGLSVQLLVAGALPVVLPFHVLRLVHRQGDQATTKAGKRVSSVVATVGTSGFMHPPSIVGVSCLCRHSASEPEKWMCQASAETFETFERALGYAIYYFRRRLISLPARTCRCPCPSPSWCPPLRRCPTSPSCSHRWSSRRRRRPRSSRRPLSPTSLRRSSSALSAIPAS